MVAVIEQSITPLAAKLGQQKYVIAIRDGFTAALPFMIIGSFMLVFIFPPFSADTTNSFARGWLDFSQTYREQLMLPFNLSMGVMTFFISVGIGASLGRQFQLDPVMSGLLAFMAFLLVAAPYADGKISTQYLSGQGIFTALITAIYSTRVYAWLKQNNVTIRLPKEVPTGVARSFEILIPVMVVLVGVRVIRQRPLLFNHSILSLFLILILGSLTLGFAFGDKWSLCSSTGWGGAFGIASSALLRTHIGVLGTLILLLGCWILTGVFINRNFINKVNRAGKAQGEA